jgi:hypothetical protein
MKLYTIDNALLTECPEIRIGDKVYPLDDRQKTAEKAMKLISENGADSIKESAKMIRETFTLVFGKEHAQEIEDMNLRYPAYLRLFETVIAAMSGEEPEEVSKRFQNRKDRDSK